MEYEGDQKGTGRRGTAEIKTDKGQHKKKIKGKIATMKLRRCWDTGCQTSFGASRFQNILIFKDLSLNPGDILQRFESSK